MGVAGVVRTCMSSAPRHRAAPVDDSPRGRRLHQHFATRRRAPRTTAGRWLSRASAGSERGACLLRPRVVTPVCGSGGVLGSTGGCREPAQEERAAGALNVLGSSTAHALTHR
jgi:hypothetical protein